MVTKTEKCSYTEFKIYPGKGRRFISKDGKTHYFINNKARKMYHQKIKPVKLTWTLAWRAFNKKIKVDDVVRKRTRKTTRVQKAVVGMSLDEIKRRKAETREQRDKNADAAAKEIKERKAKLQQQKKQQRAQQERASGVSKATKNVQKGGKAAGGARGKK